MSTKRNSNTFQFETGKTYFVLAAMSVATKVDDDSGEEFFQLSRQVKDGNEPDVTPDTPLTCTGKGRGMAKCLIGAGPRVGDEVFVHRNHVDPTDAYNVGKATTAKTPAAKLEVLKARRAALLKSLEAIEPDIAALEDQLAAAAAEVAKKRAEAEAARAAKGAAA